MSAGQHVIDGGGVLSVLDLYLETLSDVLEEHTARVTDLPWGREVKRLPPVMATFFTQDLLRTGIESPPAFPEGAQPPPTFSSLMPWVHSRKTTDEARRGLVLHAHDEGLDCDPPPKSNSKWAEQVPAQFQHTAEAFLSKPIFPPMMSLHWQRRNLPRGCKSLVFVPMNNDKKLISIDLDSTTVERRSGPVAFDGLVDRGDAL
ncbi:hypothetical protein FISHEDRAFT_74918 [Fistulina hepatica ATCC 64428]|uniref:Uncharacterized protein n=1 Tax=Fistulina hepatica ATCC 64428 TaxID=1128425 RepID=A0A0D7A8P5_9AGAR|nr:hypothetical protein FISHEDRAFT_74918 [Fistulina hepatica ATCC 64428]